MKRGALIRILSSLLISVFWSVLPCTVYAQDDFPRGIRLNEEALSATAAAEDSAAGDLNTDTDHTQQQRPATDDSAVTALPESAPSSDAIDATATTIPPASATLVAEMVGTDALTPLAQPSPTTLQSQAPTEVAEVLIEPDIDDFAKLKLDMALSSFRLNPDVRTRNMVIDAYQALVIRDCYSQVYKNLTYVPPGSLQCQSLVTRLLQFEPQNPLAICARDGFDAVGCRTAYRGQTFRSFSERSADTELDQVLDLKRNEQEFNEIQNRISNLRSDFEIHQDLESRKKLIDTMEQGIEKACRSITEGPADEITDGRELLKKYPELERIVRGEESGRSSSQGSLINMIEPTIPEGSEPTPTPIDKPYAGLLRDLAPQSEPTTVQTTRYRNASPVCYSFVTQLLEFEPLHPRATCLRDGPYSPGCLIAVKRHREAPATARPGATAVPKRRGSGGLATF